MPGCRLCTAMHLTDMTILREKRTFKDQMGYEMSLPWPPERIVSLVPSQTELLATLGLDKEVAGITKFCIHPEEWFRGKARVGGPKDINMGKVDDLKPDLIIGNKEENKEEQIKELMLRYPVWMSDIHNLEDAFGMIQSVGKLVNKSYGANELVNRIRANFGQLNEHKFTSEKVAYFIWRNPYMSVGKRSFINHMLGVLGLKNVFAGGEGDYPTVTADDIRKAFPDIIFLSSEPYPFKEKHLAEFKELCPDARVELVDGEYFSWYGSRMANAPAYFNGLFKKMGDE